MTKESVCKETFLITAQQIKPLAKSFFFEELKPTNQLYIKKVLSRLLVIDDGFFLYGLEQFFFYFFCKFLFPPSNELHN